MAKNFVFAVTHFYKDEQATTTFKEFMNISVF